MSVDTKRTGRLRSFGTRFGVLRRTSVPNLDLLPCGPIPPNPAELLNSEAFADLLDKLAETYEALQAGETRRAAGGGDNNV